MGDELFDLDDPLEAAFRELEAELELGRMKRTSPRQSVRQRPSGKSTTLDPLADLKASLDTRASHDAVIVRCPQCGANNRVPLDKLRGHQPLCGRCRHELVVSVPK